MYTTDDDDNSDLMRFLFEKFVYKLVCIELMQVYIAELIKFRTLVLIYQMFGLLFYPLLCCVTGGPRITGQLNK